MPSGLQPNNPYTLFLIFVLLLLSTNPGVDEKLAFLKTILLNTQQTVRSLQSGWQTWHNTMANFYRN